jgi:hypothetical protein
MSHINVAHSSLKIFQEMFVICVDCTFLYAVNYLKQMIGCFLMGSVFAYFSVMEVGRIQ